MVRTIGHNVIISTGQWVGNCDILAIQNILQKTNTLIKSEKSFTTQLKYTNPRSVNKQLYNFIKE